MAADEPVTSPDQHKPGNRRAARAGALFTIVALLLMLIGNHRGHIEDIWLVGSAATLAALLLVDWMLRRNGLKQ